MPDIEIVAGRDVRGDALVELQGLLRTCSPGFLAERTYYKQVPPNHGEDYEPPDTLRILYVVRLILQRMHLHSSAGSTERPSWRSLQDIGNKGL
jgi:hypothetical protein